MKTVSAWVFLGVVIVGLIHDPASLEAQSKTTPSVTGGDNKPWNKGVPVATREVARDLFLEGNRLFEVPLFAQAAEQYAAALARWKHPAFYFNLANAQLNLGQEVEAHENLERALRHGQEPLGAEEFQEAQKQLQEVRRHLGRILVTCQTPGAEVTLDGTTLFTAPGSYQGWVKARSHEVTAKKAGYLSETRRVAVSAGRLEHVELRLITLGEATDTSRRWAVWKPWAVVAAGGALAAAGGALHALSSRSFNTHDSDFRQLPCVTMPDPMAPGCPASDVPPELQARLITAKRQQAIAVGGYIAGGSVVAAGVVLLYMNRPRTAEQGAERAASRSVTVVPAVSTDMLGVSLSVSH